MCGFLIIFHCYVTSNIVSNNETKRSERNKMTAPYDGQHWKLEKDGDAVAWLGLDQQGGEMNVLSRAVLEELEKILTGLQQAPPAGLVIFSAKEKGFIAGADINEFPNIHSEQDAVNLTRRGQVIFQSLASLPCPTVAAINGFALGGGLELALACRWRIAVAEDRPTLGLPEVQLGLHPGFGGTVSTVRLLGVRQAMGLMLTGKSVTPAKALKIGLIDKLTSQAEWRTTARELLGRADKRGGAPLLDRIMNIAALRPFVARTLRAQVGARARPEHYPAPYAMIDLWQAHGAADQAYVAEAESFARLMQTETSRNLVRVYFLQERLKRTADKKQASVSNVHVVGAGIMGGDIAAWCALRGLTVTLQDREMKYIQPALDRAAKLFAKRHSDPAEEAATRARLTADVDGNGVAAADIVIEAIFEDREAKQALYRQVEPRMKEGAILATNTSSIPLQELAPCLAQPERLIGLHFFNPVAKLPLVEIVSAESSGSDYVARGLAFARQIGKLPLPCRSHPGFLVNRILAPYLSEALELAREGVPLPVIDQSAVAFGMPVGPIELSDSVGLDIAGHVAEILAPVIGRPVAPELEALIAAGHLGQKTGQGFYKYQDNKPVRPEGGDVTADHDICDRLILSLLNEAVICLDEGVVEDPELVDAGVIFGTGFAPFRGGPIQYARDRGIGDVIETLERLTARYGPRFTPAPGWEKLQP
jgi:3-hydroxyacyl-CoA dehydrogenase/enoyl-CoA hydratase/3-hydroxybutyryl-CoA epimerase